MPELGPYGSVRGAAGNSRPYRERLHDDPIHTRRRQAFEKRQWTKSREVARLRCSGLYEGLLATPTPMTDGMSRDEIDGALKRVMPSPVWSQRVRDTTRACWYGS
jgi:hypothetical protein